jgi:tRNA pseudouridine-54 N-methylase
VSRRFLIAFDELNIDADSVKSGNNSRSVVVACRCVNVGLFLSGDLRRDVEVSISTGNNDELKVITFPGSTLKRVSPDERSIAFFLLKAHNKLNEMHMGKSTMDNGIILHRTSLKDLLDSWSVEECYIATRDYNSASTYNGIPESGLFVYETVTEHLGLREFQVKLLPRPPNPERFILDINIHWDNQL